MACLRPDKRGSGVSPNWPRRLIACGLVAWVACVGLPVSANSSGFRDEMRRAVEEAERELEPAAPQSATSQAQTPQSQPPQSQPTETRPAAVPQPQPAPAIVQKAVPSSQAVAPKSAEPAPGKLLPSPLLQPAVVEPEAAEVESVAALNDPIEMINRGIMAFNVAAMKYVFDPLVNFYRRNVSVSGQRAVVNVFRNLREPVNIAAGIMQWEWGDVQLVVSRFVVNTTLGIAGMVDQASVLGFHSRIRTVDQALCRWGIPSGPYVMLPFLGPSTLRDTVARGGVLTAQALVVGVWVIPYRVADYLAQYSVTRDTWEALMLDQPDGYERLRGVYQLYSEIPCSARNAADNGLFFQ